MSVQVDIADAVVDALNAAVADTTLTETFTAVRSFAPEFTLPELETLHVSVVPTSTATEIASRAADRSSVLIGVLVQQRVAAVTGGLDDTRIAALIDLCQAIDDVFRHKALGDVATWNATDYATIYDATHLKQHLVFSSLITFTFVLWR